VVAASQAATAGQARRYLTVILPTMPAWR
jgi:hypothetical protein